MTMTPARLVEIRAMCERYRALGNPFPQTEELVAALETERARLEFLRRNAGVARGDILDRWMIYFSASALKYPVPEDGAEAPFLAAIDAAREREKGEPR